MATSAVKLDPPRFEQRESMLIAGLRGHFTHATWAGIPAQWQRLMSHGPIAGTVGSLHYGLCFNRPDGIDYLSGVEVSSVAGLPAEFSTCQIPAQQYAVFTHHGHVSELYNTMDAIQRNWAPQHELIRPSGGAPDFFESYSKEFDPHTGRGGMEIWIPVVKKS